MNRAECELEYPYFAPGEVNCDEGFCRSSARPVGTCTDGVPSSVCSTAAGAFVCDLGRCARCITDQDCAVTSGGELELCSDEGGCVASGE